MVTLIADIDGAKFISHCNLDMTQYLQKKLLNKQTFKLTPKLTPGSYTKSNPRKGFTLVLSYWIKGLVLNFGVNLWCYPKIKSPNVRCYLTVPCY